MILFERRKSWSTARSSRSGSVYRSSARPTPGPNICRRYGRGTHPGGGQGAVGGGVAGDAFLAGAGVAPVHRLLVGAGLHALAVAPALLLVEEDDAVLGPLVEGLARTGGQAGGVRAVVADAGQVEEPRVVNRQLVAAVPPRFG